MSAEPGALIRDPAVVLSLLVGAFHTCMYIVIRGRLGLHVVGVLAAAIVGALCGALIGERVGDLLRIGDYPLLWASAMAWMGILAVAGAGTLAGGGPDDGDAGGSIRPRHDGRRDEP
jgi:hypothetical protein